MTKKDAMQLLAEYEKTQDKVFNLILKATAKKIELENRLIELEGDVTDNEPLADAYQFTCQFLSKATALLQTKEIPSH